MKPFTKLLVGLGVIGLCTQLYSQNLEPPTTKNTNVVQQTGDLSEQAGASGLSSSSSQQNYLVLGLECGMYLCEEWKPGSIVLEDGTTFEDRMIRYNIYNQQMEYVWQGDTSAIGNPETLKKLNIDDKTFVYRQFVCNDLIRQGYLQLLVEGSHELLLHRGIKYVYEENREGAGTSGPVTKYYQDSRYFLACYGKIAEPLPENKNEIIAMLDQDEKELKKFVKDNKCKLKSQDELVEFFVFVNK